MKTNYFSSMIIKKSNNIKTSVLILFKCLLQPKTQKRKPFKLAFTTNLATQVFYYPT